MDETWMRADRTEEEEFERALAEEDDGDLWGSEWGESEIPFGDG